MTDEPRNGHPSTVREVGIEVAHLRDDFVDLRTELRAYIVTHGDSHKALQAEVDLNTDWRKEREVYEGIAKWLIGSNVAVLLGLIVAVFALMR